MSLLKWLKKSVVQQPGLPNPLDEVTVDRQYMVASTNEAVTGVMPAANSKQKRGDYQVYELQIFLCCLGLKIRQIKTPPNFQKANSPNLAPSKIKGYTVGYRYV